MQFVVNETDKGIVSPDQKLCKVFNCGNLRLKKSSNRPHAFCKKHAGLKYQMPKKKFKSLINNSEMVQQ